MANKWTNNGVNCLSLSDEIGSNLPKYPKEKERESGGGGGGFSARDGMGSAESVENPKKSLALFGFFFR